MGNIGKAIKKGFQAAVNVVKENIDVVQTALDVAGMIPVVGEVFDAVNGAIYAARGDATNAALSFAACVPVVGNVAGGAKIVKNVVKAVAKAGDGTSIFKKYNFRANVIKKAGMTKDTAKGLDDYRYRYLVLPAQLCLNSRYTPFQGKRSDVSFVIQLLKCVFSFSSSNI